MNQFLKVWLVRRSLGEGGSLGVGASGKRDSNPQPTAWKAVALAN